LVWLILLICVPVYIVADAFFEVSAKLSGWWKLRARPVLRRVWGAVAGRSPAIRESRKVEVAPAAPARNAAPSLPEHGGAGARGAISPAEILAFLWKAKWLILFLSIFVVVVGTMRGCTPPFAKSRDTLRAELQDASENTAVATHETKLATKAIELSEETTRDRSRRERVIAETEQELTDAVEASDFDRLYDAYERGTRGLWLELEPADSANPASPGIAPVRRAGANAA